MMMMIQNELTRNIFSRRSFNFQSESRKKREIINTVPVLKKSQSHKKKKKNQDEIFKKNDSCSITLVFMFFRGFKSSFLGIDFKDVGKILIIKLKHLKNVFNGNEKNKQTKQQTPLTVKVRSSTMTTRAHLKKTQRK